MNITVCIGSSCHLKGSRQVVEELQSLISKNDLTELINLSGKFCVNNCQNGVCVMLEDEAFSLSPETTKDFFENEILKRL